MGSFLTRGRHAERCCGGGTDRGGFWGRIPGRGASVVAIGGASTPSRRGVRLRGEGSGVAVVGGLMGPGAFACTAWWRV